MTAQTAKKHWTALQNGDTFVGYNGERFVVRSDVHRGGPFDAETEDGRTVWYVAMNDEMVEIV